jgi:hypothetical protein
LPCDGFSWALSGMTGGLRFRINTLDNNTIV